FRLSLTLVKTLRLHAGHSGDTRVVHAWPRGRSDWPAKGRIVARVAQPEVDRFQRSRVDKFEARRAELADATLATLGELGYARTSLREIAQKTEFSHGVLHYYFRDKNEL